VLLKPTTKQISKLSAAALAAVGWTGLLLLVVPLIANMGADWKLTLRSYMVFRVQTGLDVGYSFYVVNPPTQADPVMLLQLVGFGVVLSGLLWASRWFFAEQLKHFTSRFR
jgi:hypothetical protein